jgi:hypothetical protein
MKTLTATDAKNRFGELIDMAQAEPARVQRQGRAGEVVLPPKEFRCRPKPRQARSIRRLEEAARGKRQALGQVYEALAK